MDLSLNIQLHYETPESWAVHAVADLQSLLEDHARCEQKAAASAMSYVNSYMDKPQIVEPMLSLAREELQHFQQVYRWVKKLGGMKIGMEVNPYVSRLRKLITHHQDRHLLDRLLVSALIELRSCERLTLLSKTLAHPGLATFYTRLAKEESAHTQIFLRIANLFYEEDLIKNRLSELLAEEAKIVSSLPFLSRIH